MCALIARRTVQHSAHKGSFPSERTTLSHSLTLFVGCSFIYFFFFWKTLGFALGHDAFSANDFHRNVGCSIKTSRIFSGRKYIPVVKITLDLGICKKKSHGTPKTFIVYTWQVVLYGNNLDFILRIFVVNSSWPPARWELFPNVYLNSIQVHWHFSFCSRASWLWSRIGPKCTPPTYVFICTGILYLMCTHGICFQLNSKCSIRYDGCT